MPVTTEITSRKNPKIQLLHSLTNEKSARKEQGMVLCEGEKLLEEAVSSKIAPLEIFVIQKKLSVLSSPVFCKMAEKTPVTVISENIAEYISSVKSYQGLFFLLKLLDKFNFCDIINNAARVIILEDLQDPGNVGTIIRTCEAFGIDLILVSENCADVNSPKVIRSSAGSVFRIPVCIVNVTDAINKLKEKGFRVSAAVADKTALPLRKLPEKDKSAFVIGNEGAGITEKTAGICTDKVYIPIKSVRSLNAAVAAAIIIYETGV